MLSVGVRHVLLYPSRINQLIWKRFAKQTGSTLSKFEFRNPRGPVNPFIIYRPARMYKGQYRGSWFDRAVLIVRFAFGAIDIVTRGTSDAANQHFRRAALRRGACHPRTTAYVPTKRNCSRHINFLKTMGYSCRQMYTRLRRIMVGRVENARPSERYVIGTVARQSTIVKSEECEDTKGASRKSQLSQYYNVAVY